MSFIEGNRFQSLEPSLIECSNPSNGHALPAIPRGSPLDADRAATSCVQANNDGRWRLSSPSFRKTALRRFAELIAAEAPSLDAVDAIDMGKPISLSLFNASAGARLASYCADVADTIVGTTLTSDAGSYITQRWVPRGVVAAIVPWNFPTFNAIMKVAPALAAGNCVILKPSELSSTSAIRLAELALAAGIPAGAFNVVVGAGDTVGRALALHDQVDMLTFTGSTHIGRLMLQYAGQSNFKSVVAECGGKCPVLVFGDGVDLDAAADWIAGFAASNQGQICSLASRILVERKIAHEIAERIAERLQRVVIGNALDASTTYGPLSSAPHMNRVLEFIQNARMQRGTLVTGGNRVLPESGGYYVEPTIFVDVDPQGKLAQQEVFGPVLAIIPFDSEDQAVKIANETDYGLAAYVWTTDYARAMRMSALRSSVWVYAGRTGGEGAGHALSSEPARLSGLGAEGGIPGIQAYMRRQTLAHHFG